VPFLFFAANLNRREHLRGRRPASWTGGSATQNTGAGTLTLRIYRTHAIQPENVGVTTDHIVTVFEDDPNPATFNAADSMKRFLVTAVTAAGADHDDIELSCVTQTPDRNCEACNLGIALPVDFTGGILQSTGTLRPVVFDRDLRTGRAVYRVLAASLS